MDDERARQLCEDYDVVLCPSVARASALCKQVAATGAGGVFGTQVTSFAAWLRGVWELAGDGRAIAGSMAQVLVMGSVIARAELRHLRPTPRLASAAARFVRQGAGLAAFDCALADAGCVSDEELAHVAPAARFASPGQRSAALPHDASLAERELLLLCVEYLRALADRRIGLVERGHAMALLAADADVAFPRPLSVCVVGDAPFQPAEREFWQRLEGRVSCTQVCLDGTPWPQDGPDLDRLLSPELVRPPEDVCVRFAFPAGRYAQAPLVADVISELHGELKKNAQDNPVKALGAHPDATWQDGAQMDASRPGILVASVDPLSLYEQLVPALVERGVTCAVVGERKFADTAFGRAYISLYECIESSGIGVGAAHADASDGAHVDAGDGMRAGVPTWDRRHLADVLYNPVLGIDHAQASRIYARLRADRLLLCADALDELACEHPRLAALRALVCDPAPSAFEEFSALLSDLPDADSLFLAEQRAALELVRQACATLAACELQDGAPHPPIPSDLLEEIANATTVVRHAAYPPERTKAPDVAVMSLTDAAGQGAASCAALVVCDLDSEHYSVASRDDAVMLLLDKLGVPRGEGRLERQRRMWRELVAVPTRHLVLGRVLNDVDGEPTYPCAMLEEFTDLYREDTRTTDDLHRVFAIPPVLQAGIHVGPHETALFSRGEDGFTDNVAFGLDFQQMRDAPATPLEGEALERLLHRLRRPSRSEWPDGVEPATSPDAPLRLSPSQIDAYLECPYKWFATRWMGIGVPDEDFTSLEKGSFAHEALHLFFERFGRKPAARADDKDEAFACMAEVIEELLAAQEERPCGKRLAPLPNSAIELGEVTDICKDLQRCVAHEPSFLAETDFAPALFEFSFPDGGVEFAGCRLTGIIDRVDVDGRGNAVVVDYKGSIGAAYDLPKKKEYAERGLAGKKLQALLYMGAIAKSKELRKAMSAAAGKRIERAVGALYLSYKCVPNKIAVRGALAGEVGETGIVLPTASSTMPRYALMPDGENTSLMELLCAVEDMVRTQVVARIEAGCVEKKPRNKGACEHCPVAACEGRLG